jgi:hypothetical protein
MLALDRVDARELCLTNGDLVCARHGIALSRGSDPSGTVVRLSARYVFATYQFEEYLSASVVARIAQSIVAPRFLLEGAQHLRRVTNTTNIGTQNGISNDAKLSDCQTPARCLVVQKETTWRVGAHPRGLSRASLRTVVGGTPVSGYGTPPLLIWFIGAYCVYREQRRFGMLSQSNSLLDSV